MSKYSEELRAFWQSFAEERGSGVAMSAHEVAAWAISRGLWKPRPRDVIDQLADDLSRAWREEYRTDEAGRRYRAKHAGRTKENGTQMTLWADIDSAPVAHMERAFAQRRQQIVGDCVQLKTDVDVFNDRSEGQKPIPLVLDFSDDVSEAMSFQRRRAA